jgi:hypothetical protein
MNDELLAGLHGGSAALSAMLAIVFLRYWKHQHDRLFGFFAGAFAWFAAGWVIRLIAGIDEHRPYVFIPRIIGFVLIIVAILDKSRRARPGA